MFVIMSGSSGVGKNTVIKEMQKTMHNLVLMPTYTTREKREGEVEGLPYFYHQVMVIVQIKRKYHRRGVELQQQ